VADPRQPDLTLLGADHVKAYQDTDGEVGYVWNGVPTLLLTTTGRKTGARHTTPLIFGRDGDRYVVIASMGGMPMHPQWYRNLVADPAAHVQVRGEHRDVTAATAEGDQRARLWALMADQWPNYDVYQGRTDRVIPVVILTPA
jgi:deazaflavin-dependent oxidoreductase (nitroreductase family)